MPLTRVKSMFGKDKCLYPAARDAIFSYEISSEQINFTNRDYNVISSCIFECLLVKFL